MPRIGTVTQVWRYPVKSMGGEQLGGSWLGERGVPGDRGWALRDDVVREIRGAKNFPLLLRCTARYHEEPSADRVPRAEITLPDGERVWTDDGRASARLSDLVGRPVTLCALEPAENREHYRRAAPESGDLERELRTIFGRLDDEPLPDLTVFPAELMEFTSPLGTYFDAFPVHLLTTASLAALGRVAPDSQFDPRRFRPNLLVELSDGASGYVELGWCGRRLHVGEAILQVEVATPRCSMTIQPQGDLAKDPSVLRTIVRDADQNLGVYASVLSAGRVVVGAPVELL